MPLAHDATHVNAVAGVQSPSMSSLRSRAPPLESAATHVGAAAAAQSPWTSALMSRALPLESAGHCAAASPASELTDEELELQLTRKTPTKITRPVLTTFSKVTPPGVQMAASVPGHDESVVPE